MPKLKPTFSRKDFPAIAEFVADEHGKRRREREQSGLEHQWEEIDRQIAMTPDLSHKLTNTGEKDPRLSWLPEIELPNQAQTLEVLSTDALRMQMPDNGHWFSANAEMTDELLAKIDFKSIITGDEAEVPSMINQDNLNKLVEGTHLHWQRQYPFADHLGMINAEAFKYGMGVGRGRLVKKRVMAHTARGVESAEAMIPVLVPRSIRKTYLDESLAMVMNEGQMLGPSVIEERWQHITDLKKAASVGSTDPKDENGGWMASNIRGMDGNKHNLVQLLEFEGDLIVPRKTTSNILIPSAIVTIAIGESGGKTVSRVVRLRFRKLPFSSYISFPYLRESVSTSYATSPIMKGRPIQVAATDALITMIVVGKLNGLPPVQYDADDAHFAENGGPMIHPAALWGSVGDVKVQQIGKLGEAQAVYIALLQQYADVTGVNAPRLGAQTVSHTTAFAKDVENTRGQSRTVGYVRRSLSGPMTQWLDMEYQLGRDSFTKKSIFIEEYGGFVDVEKAFLPERVTHVAHGAGGPQEEVAKQQAKLESLTLALQMDQAAVQAGAEPTILPNMPDVIREVLRNGGWTDTDFIAGSARVPEGAATEPALGQLVGLLAQPPAA